MKTYLVAYAWQDNTGSGFSNAKVEYDREPSWEELEDLELKLAEMFARTSCIFPIANSKKPS